jgi:Cation transporter/ATPase, N-terminus
MGVKVRDRSERQPGGLTSEEGARVLAQVGPNAIAEAEGPSHLRRFAANFVQLHALLLWVGALLALGAGLPQLSAAIGS